MTATLYSAGTSSSYRLGRSTPNNSNKVPTPVDIDLKGVVCIASGWQHNVIVYLNGSVSGWGSNTDGQIGFIEKLNENRPTRVTTLEDYKIVWAACGDKITAYLTDTGSVFVANRRTPKGLPYKLNIPIPCVYVASSINYALAIGKDGSLFIADEDPTKDPIKYQFPKPIYDVASGENFTIAVTIENIAYGIGKITSDSKTFVPIPSLDKIKVLRVFGYNQHSAIITTDGLVYTWGSGGNGRLGHGNEDALAQFQLVKALSNKVIVDIDMGDSHTVFIDQDGNVYACGASDDGRLMLNESFSYTTPKQSKNIPGRAVYATCGCFHTYVLTGDVQIVHPGMKKFLIGHNLLSASSVLAGNEEINVDVHSMLQCGLLPGDVVKVDDVIGNVFGVASSGKIALVVNGNLMLMPIMNAKLITRRGYIGVKVVHMGQTLTIDGGALLKSYGLVHGETLFEISIPTNQIQQAAAASNSSITNQVSSSTNSNSASNNNNADMNNNIKVNVGDDVNEFKVMGVFGNFLYLQNMKTVAIVQVEGTLKEVFSTYKLHQSSRDIIEITIKGVNYPCEKVKPFFLHGKEPIKIMAKFAFSYVGQDSKGNFAFYKEETVSAIETNGCFYAFDIVNVKIDENRQVRGMITSVGKDSAVVITENPQTQSAAIIPTANLSLIARVVPETYKTIGNMKLNISPLFKSDMTSNDKIYMNCCPGDIYVHPDKGFITVVGFDEEMTPFSRLLKKNDCDVDQIQKEDLFKFVPEECKLIRRVYEIGDDNSVYNQSFIPLVVSTLQSSMNGTGFLQADEVLVDGETKAVILGTKDRYIYFKSFAGEVFCIYLYDSDCKDRIKFVERPTSNFSLLLD